MIRRLRANKWVLLSMLCTVIGTGTRSNPVVCVAKPSKHSAMADQGAEKVKGEIVALIDRFDKAINEGDVAGSVAVYDQDVESFPLFTLKYVTSVQRLAAAKRAAESGVKVTTRRNDDLKVHVVGESWAWATWTWHAVSVPPQGEKTEAAGRTRFSLEKRDGAWKVVHSHISQPIRPGGPPVPSSRPTGNR